MRLRPKGSADQIDKLVRRVLRNNRTNSDIPVIIVGPLEADRPVISIGRVLSRAGGQVSVMVDNPLPCDVAVTVFLPEQVFLGETISCCSTGTKHTLELLLIQYKRDE